VVMSANIQFFLSVGSSQDINQIKASQLVSVISTRGADLRAHYVSYHLAGDWWYLNDDSRDISRAADPLLQLLPDEAVSILFYSSNG